MAKIMIDNAEANTGRSTKKREKFMTKVPSGAAFQGRAR
jgi:hypothetical protein